MITIIAGSRSITDYEIVKEAIEKSGFDIISIVSGGPEAWIRSGNSTPGKMELNSNSFQPMGKTSRIRVSTDQPVWHPETSLAQPFPDMSVKAYGQLEFNF